VPSMRVNDAPWFRLVLACGHVTYRKYLRATAGCVVCGRKAGGATTPATPVPAPALTVGELVEGD
jgi:hypothetical protein